MYNSSFYKSDIWERVIGMNKKMIFQMSCNPDIVKTFLSIHLRFRNHKNYKIRNMVKCGLNIIKND